jgi:hypothetical protein
MKKAQLWYGDMILGFSIIVIIMLFFVVAFFDILGKEQEIQNLVDEAITISNSMLSPSYSPSGNLESDWCNLEGRIGFTDNMKINNEDFVRFRNMVNQVKTCGSLSGYETTKLMFGTKFDYIIYFQDKNGNFFDLPNNLNLPRKFNVRRTYGKYRINLPTNGPSGIKKIYDKIENDNPNNLINFFRFVYMDTSPEDGKGELVKMGVIVWS